MPDNFQGNFFIQVQNATNPILGQNGQGICGLTLHFDHEYLGDILITLTSPSGQEVTLIGPAGLFGETDGTTWDITFVPCDEPADADPGFSEIWSNNQNWGLFGSYTGSYYPNSGCLEDFDGGPVNGQWTLTVTDILGNDVGYFYDYSILFCDPAGIECISCEANAGNLLQNDVVACAGDVSLDLDFPPFYAPPQSPPPSNAYSYTYIIAAGGVIIAYESGPDLTDYAPGNYTVCGLSYLSSDEPDIPPPNGSLTVSQLSSQLNSSTPPFCGKITANCVNVNIQAIPPDIEDFETICAPDCFEYYGEKFCESGDYQLSINQNNCEITATLHLTVIQPVIDTLFETICPGSCSQTPEFEQACITGTYTLNYPGSNGCDSIITLILNVLSAQALVDPPPPILCDQPSIILNGDSSTTGVNVTYHWTASNGGNIIGPIDESQTTVDSAGSYYLEVCNIENGLQCCDTATVVVVAEQNPPAAPDTILGPQKICFGQVASWSVDSVIDASGYYWELPPGVTLVSNPDSTTIMLKWESSNADSLCVTAENACGSSVATCLLIEPIDTLPNIAPPNGKNLVCNGDTLIYTAITNSDSSTIEWNVPQGITILSGQGTDTILIIWNSDSNGEICFREISHCDSTDFACLDVKIFDALVVPKIIGPDTVCLASTHNYEIDSIPGSVNLNWAVTGGKLLSDNSDSHIQVQWNDQTATAKVCVQATNACGIPSEFCQNIFVQSVPDPFAGNDTSVCENIVNLAAIVDNPTNSGFWQLISGPGLITFADSLKPATTATASAPGKYLVQWTETSTHCSNTDSLALEFNSPPSISQSMPLCDSTNEHFSVKVQIAGGTPPFEINGSQLPGDLFISNPIASPGQFDFSITDAKGCTAHLSNNFDCACTSFAGIMDTVLLEACIGQTVVANHPESVVLDGNDLLAFVLHNGSGNILGQVFDQNTTGEFTWQPGMSADSIYYISAIVGNTVNGVPNPGDPCFSISAGQPVRFRKPPSPNAGLNSEHCGLSLQLMAGADTLAGSWSLVNGPGMASFSAIASANSSVSVTIPGEYIFKWTESNNLCTAFDTVSVRFNEIPELNSIEEICIGTNTAYVIQFNISGGLPPYIIDGLPGALNSNIFSSILLPSNTNYTFSITDSNGCKTPEYKGNHSCACTTNSGSMDISSNLFCIDQPAKVIYNNDYNFDADDTIQFIIHDLPGDIPGNILGVNNQPFFFFNTNFQTDKTYYISAIAGNNIGGSVDLSDPCLSVAPGAPVQWKSAPEASMYGDTTICKGASARLSFEASGAYPLTLYYTDFDGQVFQTEINSGQYSDVYVSPDTNSLYTLISVQDGTAPQCTTQLSDSVFIWVQNPPEAGMSGVVASFCKDNFHLIHLGDLLSGENAGGQWSEVSTAPSTLNAFDALNGTFQTNGQSPGIYTFRYLVSGTAPCPADSADVSIQLHENPKADAGPDQLLDCWTPNTILGGSASGSGNAGLQFSWHKQSHMQPLGDSSLLLVSEPGIYILKVTDSLGCSAIDTTLVTQTSSPIQVESIKIKPIRCFGEHNGSIQIDSVEGGVPPILFSLNGQPYSNNMIFNHLQSGTYVLSAQDITGCEWLDTVHISEPAEIKIELGPNIQAALGDSVYLWLQSSVTTGELDTIIWSPLLDTLNAGRFKQHILPLHSGRFSVLVTDTSGCIARDEITIQIDRKRRVYIPNAFRPDAPKDNLFEISLGNDVRSIESFRIFNRWGELIRETENVSPGDSRMKWDGTIRGQKAPSGVYPYYLVVYFLDGTSEVFSGTVTLLR